MPATELQPVLRQPNPAVLAELDRVELPKAGPAR